MKDSVEMTYVSDDSNGYWKLSVTNDFIKTQSVALPAEVAMIVAMAIATLKNLSNKKKNDKHK